mmetsp:Transcript_10800/g.22307  ORF Transcript_10800/g.22307 Transcript_10800/m.22307 type:complete len:235 (+) Transcript_10800:98-802(+)|eukprot:CAMPEP_0196717376 /NCGR_PEP_ID=MMETSP1091-20130531/739_1 /TAXON_ID=302021 /ORGANISM="Rhodomonas sp., Strain CCMP768" /LENGTH=234 /DNA_ID=CAMNT_0042057673 /DNA_START=97 /DNA_END=801 /DNA_ORIENTATION=-
MLTTCLVLGLCAALLPTTTAFQIASHKPTAFGASASLERANLRARTPLSACCSVGAAGAGEAEHESRPSLTRRELVEGMAAGAMISSRMGRNSRNMFGVQEGNTANPRAGFFEILPVLTDKLEQEIAFWTRGLGMTVHSDEAALLVSFSTQPRSKELALRLDERPSSAKPSSSVLGVQVPFRPRLMQDIEMTGGEVISHGTGEMRVRSPSGQQVLIEQSQASIMVAPSLRVASS